MNVLRLPAHAAISVFLLLGGGVVMTIAWELLFTGRVYQCNDSLGFPGFLMPGRWVHEPITYVDTVDPNPPMSTHDSLKKGWSVAKLWWAWWGMFAVLIMTSLTPIVACFLRGDPDGEDGQVSADRAP